MSRPRSPTRARSRVTVALLLLAGAAGCRGDKKAGESCSSNGECASEMCVQTLFSSTCVERCGRDEQCPAGQRCIGRAAGYVAYCDVDVEPDR